jgi:guanyl-specific ribonuclease Sa
MNRKIVTVLAVLLAVSLLVVPFSYAGFAAKLKKHILRTFVEQIINSTTSGASTWVEIAQVTINAPKDGDVKVTASGMIVFPNANDTVTMSIATTSAAGGPWVFSTDGVLFQNFNVEMVFPVVKGPNTFYFNAVSFFGGGGSISVEVGLLEALFMSNQISPSAAFGEAVLEEPLSDGSNE